MQNRKKQLIESVMNDFDFDKAYKVFVLFDYNYGGATAPNVEELQKIAKNLLETAYGEGKRWSKTESGRFCAIYSPETQYDDESLALYFTPITAHAY